MTDVIVSAEAVVEVQPARLAPEVLDGQLVSQLVDRAQADGIKLTGEGGLPQLLTKKILESALEGEITDRLGCEKREKTRSGNTLDPTGQGPERPTQCTARRERAFSQWESAVLLQTPCGRTSWANAASTPRSKVVMRRRPKAEHLRNLTVPNLVLLAEHSRGHDVRRVAVGARRLLPQATVARLPDASHYSIPTGRRL
ncbi:alpha/beta fold hydrolase [Streptomyces sp. NPDC059564]|uniref:alpha/beta fold hydrolase n=1 Tax=Streptomyces sp. NPDC059564 TaxID=3346865 RepID=UPI00368FD416